MHAPACTPTEMFNAAVLCGLLLDPSLLTSEDDELLDARMRNTAKPLPRRLE